jgi:protein Mpv17
MATAAIRRGLRAYDAALKESPLRTKGVTSVVIAIMGDTIAQRSATVQPASTNIDVVRCARQSAWSAACSPLAHYWMAFLGRFSTRPLLGVAIDQFIYSPPVHIAYLAWIASASSGFSSSQAEVVAEVREKFVPAMQASWCVWPAAIAVNIRFVPSDYRVLFLNVIGLGYGIIMSRLANERLPSSAAVLPDSVPAVSAARGRLQTALTARL